VCRCCRFVFEEPRSIPFCDTDCAATWALCFIDQNRLQARMLYLRFFVCEQPPVNLQGWQTVEHSALAMEVC